MCLAFFVQKSSQHNGGVDCCLWSPCTMMKLAQKRQEGISMIPEKIFWAILSLEALWQSAWKEKTLQKSHWKNWESHNSGRLWGVLEKQAKEIWSLKMVLGGEVYYRNRPRRCLIWFCFVLVKCCKPLLLPRFPGLFLRRHFPGHHCRRRGRKPKVVGWVGGFKEVAFKEEM